MNGKTVVFLILGVVLALAKVALRSSRSSSRADFDSYRSSSLGVGGGYGYGNTLGAATGLSEAKRAIAEYDAAREAAVERDCSREAQHVYFEPQSPEILSVLSLHNLWLPKGVTPPKPRTVMGLKVLPKLHRRSEIIDCVNVAESLWTSTERNGAGPATARVSKLAPGAWSVVTTPFDDMPALSALTSKAFLAQFHTQGPLVVFSADDDQLSFADSSSLAAVNAAAAFASTKVHQPSETFTTASAMIFKDGAWTEWTPPVTAQTTTWKARAHESRQQFLQDVATSSLTLYRAAVALGEVPDQHDAISELEEPDPLTVSRKADAKEKVTASISELREASQFIARADRVEVTDLESRTVTLSWDAFLKGSRTQVKPANIGGVLIPDVYVVQADFEWSNRDAFRTAPVARKN